MEELRVDLGDRSYPILIGSNILQAFDVRQYIPGSQALVVSNETVAPIYLDMVVEGLQGKDVQTLILPDGEKYKSLEYLSNIFDALIEHKHNRTTTLIALGGGVIGDMTGFAAACYQRGVNFIQVPTTLLAQVDSSVGGKTAVNHPRGKNMLGAFYQPRAVVIDTQTLSTLPDREYSAGMAEVIKYGLIADELFLQWLEGNMDALMQRKPEEIAVAVRRSCATKAQVVAEDETEQGLRAILNLGHTFGHAIEAAQSYSDWLHGEAVAAGMVLAAEFSCELGWIEQADVDRTRQILAKASLPTQVPDNIGTDLFMELMGLDKKVQNGKLRLVLLRALGEAVVTDEFDMGSLRDFVSQTQAAD